jgi:transcriptional regulator GlxA family with amidase domain
MEIEILIYDGFDDLDAFGPFEVLTGAGFDTRLVTLEPRDTVRSSHGATIVPDGVLGDPDLVLVPGGGWNDGNPQGARGEADKGDIPRALATRHAAGRRVGSVCTGAMLLAAAGILDGRPAITHHSAIEDLKRYGADVREDQRFVDDGDIVTAGGVTSGIDLALHIVAQHKGERVAELAAREIEWENPRGPARPATTVSRVERAPVGHP